jgi:hypothetical protein
MTEQSLDSKFLEIVGPAIASAVGAALAWLTGGSGYLAGALRTVFTAIGGIGALAFSIIYQRYLGVLASGGDRKGSPARAAYDSLRESLSGENVVARIYIQRLRAFLDWMERFFGDVGMADRTLFPHFLGLKTPASSWTAPAFERCLLLALIYPIVTIVLIWVITGHIGPAEAALHLPPGTSGLRRIAGMVLIFLSSYAWSRCYRAEGWVKRFAWLAVASAFASAIAGVYAVAVGVAVAVALAVAFAGAFAGVFGFAFAFAVAGAVAVIVTVAVAVAVAATGAGAGASAVAGAVAVGVAVTVTVAVTVAFVGALAGAFAFAFAFAFVVTVAAFGTLADVVAYAGAGAPGLAIVVTFTFFVAFFIALAFVVVLTLAFAGAFAGAFAITSQFASGQNWTFLAVLVAGMLVLFIGIIPALVASGPVWTTVGPLFLFIGLLTLINAPFDWVSLGLTRALLHRGLELGGWWPYFFALIDAALAAVIITLLAAFMVIGVQAFDTVTVHSGGETVLPLRELIDGVAARPSEPEYWWLYAVLISSMIPSMLNLAIGGIAFLRGVPGLPWVVRWFLPAGQAVAPFDRRWIALVLTAQIFVGGILGVVAQTVLSIGVIGYGLPRLGFHILDVARYLDDVNLPEHLWALFVR